MRKIGFFVCIIGCFFTINFFASCSNNKKELLFVCDSIHVKYSVNVKPILQNNCYNCHATSTAPSFGSGIILDNHTDITTWVNTTVGSDGGLLLQNLKTGRMPKGASKLNSCDVAKIAKWIRDGALNN